MELNYQRDPNWINAVMTEADPEKDPMRRKWRDTLGMYGCLVSCLSNIIAMTSKKSFTPKQLNDTLRGCKGYNYLFNPNAPEGKASFIRWEAFQSLYPILKVELNCEKSVLESSGDYYIARIIMFESGHYVNVLRSLPGGGILIYDTWNGKTRILNESEITTYHRISVV